MDIVLTLLVGLVAGVLLSTFMRERAAGVTEDIFVGIVGALFGAYMVEALGIYTGTSLLPILIGAFVAAIVFVGIISLIHGGRLYGRTKT